MEELFGISMNAIALFLLVVFLIVAVLIGVLAWRNRIMLKLGIRNIPRRRAQTALIIIGLMLSTVIITSAFGTGDTIVYTLRSLATRSMGNTDEVVDSGITATGSPNYFQYSRFEELRDGLLDYDKVDAVVPSILEIAPLIDMTTRQNASRVTLFAPDSDYASDLVQMTTEQG